MLFVGLERDVLQRGLDVVMRGAVTNNCFHQGNGPQNDLAQDLGRLDIHRIHAVDAEQNQTSNAATQNVIVHKSNLLYFSHRLTPEAQVSAGRFPLSASLLYRSFDIKQDDTLEHPQHIDQQFEAIVANPPFSAQWSANPLFTSDDRFSQYGRLAPGSKADFAFVQHMVYHLADNGTMALVLPHGALFRGGAEQHIRRYLIENKNFLDAVIGLPANIFYGTSIPTCILVFKKCRENPEDILFIDASGSDHYEKVKTQNVLRTKDIDLIIETYRSRTETAKFSKKASLEEIAKNDYNLNIPRYVDTFEAEESIDIDAIANELKSLENDIQSTDATIAQFCKELNISTPF